MRNSDGFDLNWKATSIPDRRVNSAKNMNQAFEYVVGRKSDRDDIWFPRLYSEGELQMETDGKILVVDDNDFIRIAVSKCCHALAMKCHQPIAGKLD